MFAKRPKTRGSMRTAIVDADIERHSIIAVGTLLPHIVVVHMHVGMLFLGQAMRSPIFQKDQHVFCEGSPEHSWSFLPRTASGPVSA